MAIDKYGRRINPNYQSRPISSFASTYQRHTTMTYRRNVWQRMNDFVANIGEWIDENREALSINISTGFYFLAWLGLAIGVVAQLFTSFWSALFTAIIGGVVVYFAAGIGVVIFVWILQIFFFIVRYILYNIYTLLLSVLLIVGICFSDQTVTPQNKTTSISNPVSNQPNRPNYYCDVSTTLRVREYPRINAKEIGQLKRYEEVYVYSIDNNFAKIDFKGRIAYASADYLKLKDSSAQSTNRNKTIETHSTISTSDMAATIKRIWEEHNVLQDQQKGMKIHVKFNTFNMHNAQGKCIAYFYYENGSTLKDNNNSYRNSDGQVIVEQNFKPSYQASLYEDFVLFIPYNELHLPSEGKSNVKVHVVIQVSPATAQPKKLATSDWIYFRYGKLE